MLRVLVVFGLNATLIFSLIIIIIIIIIISYYYRLTECAFDVSGMVNNTSIDWYLPWPEQALYAVASVFIAPDVR